MSLVYHHDMGCIEMKLGTSLDCKSLHLCLNKEYIQSKDANMISINQKSVWDITRPYQVTVTHLPRTFSQWFSVPIQDTAFKLISNSEQSWREFMFFFGWATCLSSQLPPVWYSRLPTDLSQFMKRVCGGDGKYNENHIHQLNTYISF